MAAEHPALAGGGRAWALNEDGTRALPQQEDEEEQQDDEMEEDEIASPDTLLGRILHPTAPGPPAPFAGVESLAFQQLAGMARRGELRDYGEEMTAETYRGFFELLCLVWKDGRPEAVEQVQALLSSLISVPEYDPAKAAAAATEALCRTVLSRFEAAPEAEHRFLRDFLHLLYRDCPPLRPLLRALMARFLVSFARNPRRDAAVAPVLEVLGQVIKGFGHPLTAVHTSLLHRVLLPLHRVNEMYEWRDQIPLIQRYHEPLVFCLVQYLERDRRAFAVPVMEAVLRAWPEAFQSNSPKEVLCLHEVETLLRFFSDEDFAKVLPALLPRLELCLLTDHSRCLEKALTLWKDPTVLGLTKRFSKQVIRALLRPVYRQGEMHWNTTVNKMRALVLDAFREADPEAFAAAAATAHAKPPPAASSSHALPEPEAEGVMGHLLHPQPLPPPSPLAHPPLPLAPPVAGPELRQHHFDPPKSLLRSDMGGWRPPSQQHPPSSRGGGPVTVQPPLTITGVAPWAMGPSTTGGGASSSSTAMRPPPPKLTPGKAEGGRAPPPATITGVAPWAAGKAGRGPPPPLPLPGVSGGGKKAGGASAVDGAGSGMPPSASSVLGSRRPLSRGMSSSSGSDSGGAEAAAPLPEPPATIAEEGEGDEEEMEVAVAQQQQQQRPALEGQKAAAAAAVEAGTAKEMGETEEEAAVAAAPASSEGLERVLGFMEKCRPQGPKEGEKTWQELALEPTPTLLPDMRFHDLVFGHELGSGAFSTVRYARHVAKGKTRSEWAEYAVKVVDTAKVAAKGYERCFAREISVLRLLSHPGIARMVSAFRWREGAYLVLEYASKGDLHTHLVSHGSLDEPSARFVVGEVLAALRSVHDAGFVFGDLKPENVVVTESGHVKLTDFGAARPLTPAAAAVLRASRNAVRRLRDGDWRRPQGQAAGQGGEAMAAMVEEEGGEEEEGEDGEEEDDDKRIEGTFAYLPPEVLRDGGRAPDALADSWALGCLLYQCLVGRPPVFSERGDAGEVRARVVRFAGGAEAGLFAGPPGAAALSDEAKDLIKGLLAVERDARYTLEAAAQHPFFTQHGTDVYALHRGPAIQLVQGSTAPAPDAAWNRRQFSAIWAPLPGNYTFVSTYALDAIPETPLEAPCHFYADDAL